MDNNRYNYFFAMFLVLFGGAIGLQWFYVCKNSSDIAKVVYGILSILFCWTFIPTIISLITFIYWLVLGESRWNDRYNRIPGDKKPDQIIVD